jgi:hypothetical protein
MSDIARESLLPVMDERQLLSALKEHLRLAADKCYEIARQPKSGPQFDAMRKALKVCEDCCRKVGSLREDARWLPMGLKMEEAHQIAREWLHRPTVKAKKLFSGLGDQLMFFLAAIEKLETARTNRVGMILPKPLGAPLRESRPVQVILPPRVSAGGVILPS